MRNILKIKQNELTMFGVLRFVILASVSSLVQDILLILCCVCFIVTTCNFAFLVAVTHRILGRQTKRANIRRNDTIKKIRKS